MQQIKRPMRDWDSYRYFLELHRHGSLKAAAERLGVDQTTVARNIAALEARAGVKFFQKRSDGFFLTASGARILESLERVEQELLGIERKVAGEDERASGRVRLALPGALSSFWLIPRIPALLSRAPGLELELLTGPEVVNLSRREADLAIRFVRPAQRDLYARKAGEIRLAVYGKAGFAAGSRRTGLEPWVGLYAASTSDAEAALQRKAGSPSGASVRSAAWTSVYFAVREGLGYGILPTFIGDADPGLARVRGMPEGRTSIWLVVHPEIRSSRRIRLVLEFLARELEKSFA